MDIYSSAPVSVSPLLPMLKHFKLLRAKAWHMKDRGYAKRIQKKWDKKYGTELIHCLKMADHYLVSPQAWQELRRGH